MGDDPARFTDSGVVVVNGDQVGVLDGAELQVLRVQHPVCGVLHVSWPAGETPTLDEVLDTLGEPGGVKGPSAAVWGDEHASAMTPLLGVVTPQGDGAPVKGPGDGYAADEVVDEVREAEDGDGIIDRW